MKSMTQNKQLIVVQNVEGNSETVAEVITYNNIEYTPKVSVIIPVYNVEKYLRECLDSVLKQTLREIEVICVDDGSTDSSLNILKEYAAKDSRMTVVRQDNLRAGVARNAGLALAKGEYVTFLDSDDFFESEMLEECYNRLKKDQSDVCIFSARKIDYSINEVLDMPWLCPKENTVLDIDEIKGEIIAKTSPNCWNKLFSRRVVETYNIRFQSIANANDVYFSYLACAVSKRISVIPKQFVNYRFNTGHQITTKLSQVSPLNIYYALSQLKEDIQKIKGEGFFTEGFYKKCIDLSKYQRLKNYLGFESNKGTYRQLFSADSVYLFDKAFKPAAVVFSADDSCVQSLIASISSVQAHLPQDSACRVFILHEGLSEHYKTKLRKLSTYSVSIELIDVAPYLEKYHLYERTHSLRKTYYKFLIPHIFKSEIRVLYIDSDVDVCANIINLFQEDLKQNIIATTQSTLTEAGVMMFNIQVWTRMGLVSKCLNLAPKYNHSWNSDRDILNEICAGRIHFFPREWKVYHKRKKSCFSLLKQYMFFPYYILRLQKLRKKRLGMTSKVYRARAQDIITNKHPTEHDKGNQ